MQLPYRMPLPRRMPSRMPWSALSGLGDVNESQRIFLQSQIDRLEQQKSQCSGGEGGWQECAAQLENQIAPLRQALAAIPAPAVAAPAPAPASSNPDTRPAAERAAADQQVRQMSDAQVREAVYGDKFSGAEYLARYPDVAADSYWGKNPERHFLAYGQYEGRVYPDGSWLAAQQREKATIAPSGVTVTPMTPESKPLITGIPAMPAIPSFAPTPVPAPAGVNPLAFTGGASNSMQLTPSAGAQGLMPLTSSAPKPAAQSALPAWLLPAGIAVGALVLIPLLTGKPSPAPAAATKPARRAKKGK